MKYTVEEHIQCRECGGCKNWHEWSAERIQQERAKYEELGLTYNYGTLSNGDCDKIARGRTWNDGDTYSYGGYSIEDECYDEVFHCFEPREESEVQ